MRLTTYGSMVGIARENLDLALKCQETVDTLCKTLENLKGDDASCFYSQKLAPVENKLSNYCVVTIVFSALAVEGYIYDYAARKLTDNFVEEHIDKLKVISKYIVVTKLVTGKDFPKDGKAYQMLKQLISNRNYIVHSKSANLMKPDAEAELAKLTKEDLLKDLPALLYSKKANDMRTFEDSLLKNAQEAIIALDELAVVMKDLDPDEHMAAHLSRNSDL
ncbi:hypothetical protein H6F88_31610 [Oculatella sp. FACHB-28]|uniref:hypothetical protein n=1 Tax=Oculatella sp. FACHB-28 TaxID=2692845 RepID=UPI00168611B8|nr:hypothetical protein [Oculatella sp. FACHB-28]MBD2060490.1 hypothetical protein [Oculatella sp. FACHB-28]